MLPIGGPDFGLQKTAIEGLKRFGRVCMRSHCRQQHAKHARGEFQHALYLIAIDREAASARIRHKRAVRMNAYIALASLMRVCHEAVARSSPGPRADRKVIRA